jgi:hypothetical protein
LVLVRNINLFLVILLLVSCARTPTTPPRNENGLLSGSELAQTIKLAQSDTSSKRASVALSKMGLSLQWDKAIAVRQTDWKSSYSDTLEAPTKTKQQIRDTLMVSTKGEHYQLVYYYLNGQLTQALAYAIRNTDKHTELALYDLKAKTASYSITDNTTKEVLAHEYHESGYKSTLEGSLSVQNRCIRPLTTDILPCPEPPSDTPAPGEPEPTEPADPAEPGDPVSPINPPPTCPVTNVPQIVGLAVRECQTPTPPTQIAKPCEAPESMKLAVRAAEESVKSAENNLAALAGAATPAALLLKAKEALAACRAGVAPCAAVAALVASAAAAVAVTQVILKSAKQGLEGAKLSLQGAKAAITEWKKANCK